MPTRRTRHATSLAQAVLDAVPVHVAVLDRAGVIAAVNTTWRQFARDNGADLSMSHSAEGVDYLAVCRAARGESSEGALEAAEGIQAVLDGRLADFSLEYTCHSPGRQRWFVLMVNPMRTPVGGVVVVHADVTQRKLAELALLESETQHRSVLQDQTEVISRFLPDGTFTFVNEVYCRFFGKTAGELLGRRWQPVAHADDLPLIEARLAELSPANPVVTIENRVYAGDGRLHWIEFVNRALYDDTGRIREIQSVGRDIGERKRMEQALHGTHVHMRLIQEAAHVGTWEWDMTNGELAWSPEMLRLYGYTEADFPGDYAAFSRRVHAEDLARTERELDAAVAEQRPFAMEFRVLPPGRESCWVLARGAVEYDAYGKPVRMFGVNIDISARKAMEARKDALVEEIARLNRELLRVQERERTALAKELHDELSQEIVAIRAHAGAIQRRGGRKVGRTREDAAAIVEAAGRIYDVSHRLMDGLHPRMLDSTGLVDALLGHLATWSQRNPDIRVIARLTSAGLPCPEEVRIQLFRIAQEALTNVAQHARARHVRMFLGVRAGPDGRLLCLVVRDDGRGIAATGSGTGYGLLTMRERARAVGGALDIRSWPGRGTRIAVDTPLPD
ncbi:MAG: PAS domain S-box protein [Thiobacillus sp.]|nr:PAS domain S-box protein [Thiobacillus sp.]